MIAALAAVALLAPPQDDAGRLSSARVRCSGPLSGLELAWPDGSSAHVRLALAAGEARELELPLPLPAAGAWGEPALRASGGGAVELAELPAENARAVAESWARVLIGLRLRPAPPAAGDGAVRARLPWRALFAAGACLALALALRARPRAALAAGALGAALALALARPEAGARAASEVLEGDGSAWVLARAARSRLELEAPARLESIPSEVALRVEGDGRRWSVSAAGALLVARRPLADLDGGALAHENDLEDLPRCWVRGADGAWSHRGPWPRGTPLPESRPGPAPPSGLVAGLPSGRGVLLAERARGEHPASARAWLRLVGFEPGPDGWAGTLPERD